MEATGYREPAAGKFRSSMKAARIHAFGSPDVISVDELPVPTPKRGEVLVRVAAAGVGPWDAWIREHKSVVQVSLPITLGSDIAGVVADVGAGVSQFAIGDQVFGVTNANFTGGYAEYAAASQSMISSKPASLDFIAAASAPVVAVTAWQMLFDYAKVESGQSVLILGAAGNVGSYAVQMAAQAGVRVFATASSDAAGYVRGLGAAEVIDYRTSHLEDAVPQVDVVLDLVGDGSLRDSALTRIKAGGILVSAVSELKQGTGSIVRSVFFLVEVTSARLKKLAELFDAGRLKANVGAVVPLNEVRLSHAMLAGAPHPRGKIVLQIGEFQR